MAREKDRQPGMALMPFDSTPASGAARGRDGVSAQVNQAVCLSSHVCEPPPCPRTLVPEARPTVQLSINHVPYLQYTVSARAVPSSWVDTERSGGLGKMCRMYDGRSWDAPGQRFVQVGGGASMGGD